MAGDNVGHDIYDSGHLVKSQVQFSDYVPATTTRMRHYATISPNNIAREYLRQRRYRPDR